MTDAGFAVPGPNSRACPDIGRGLQPHDSGLLHKMCASATSTYVVRELDGMSLVGVVLDIASMPLCFVCRNCV